MNVSLKIKIGHFAKISDFAKFLELFFTKLIDVLLQYFYGYGVKPIRPLAWALIFITIFGIFFWNFSGIVPSCEAENVKDESANISPIDSLNESSSISLIDSLSFSSAVFLSGTKLFVDPPNYTNKTGIPAQSNLVSISKFMFISERILGALLFFMFLYAIGKTMIR